MPISVTDAWAEAAAACPKDDVMLITIEFIHPAFTENGLPAPIRVVRNSVDMQFRLEDTASLNAGEMVPFVAIPFAIDFPRIGPVGAEATIRVDNIGRELSRHLEAAAGMNQPIQVVFRGYLASDPDTVGQGPYHMTMMSVTSKNRTLEGTVSLARTKHLRVLREVYDMERFATLLAVS